MSTYDKTYYKAITTEQANRIKAYVGAAVRNIDSNDVEKFFMPLLGSLKNGHRYIVLGCRFGPTGTLYLHRINAYFQSPEHYDTGELIELTGNMSYPFRFPEVDYRIEQIIRKFISFLFEDGNTNRLQEQDSSQSGGEVYTGRPVYGEPDGLEYAAGRTCDEACAVRQGAGIIKPQAELSIRDGEVHETSWGD